MTTHHNGVGEPLGLPDITRLDRAGYVRQARQLRAEQIDRMLLAAGQSIARLWRAASPRAAGQLSSRQSS